MSYKEEMDLTEQVARLAARVAELEERVSWLENSGPRKQAVASPSKAENAETLNPVNNEDMAGGIRAVLERLGATEAGQIRLELVKNGFPATISRSDINKALYRHTELFSKSTGDEGKPEWSLI